MTLYQYAGPNGALRENGGADWKGGRSDPAAMAGRIWSLREGDEAMVRDRRQCRLSVRPSLEQLFERAALGRVLPGIGLLELLQIYQLPAYGWKVCGIGEAEQAEVRLGVVEGE